nr:EOG090X0MTI [Eulimnadia texana]
MAGSSGRYVKTKNSNPFFDDDDLEDVDDETFLSKAPSRPKAPFGLGNTGYKYSSFSNTSTSTDQSRASQQGGSNLQSSSSEDDRHQLLLLEKQRIERETLDSSRRALGLLHESEQVGVSTAEELLRQREQLERTDGRLDDINNTLRVSEKHIQNIKSVFSSIKNYFSKGNEPTKLSSGPSNSPSMPSSGSSSQLSKVIDETKPESSAKPSGTHPGLRIRGFDDEEPQKTTTAVDEELDENLGLMSDSLARLKGLAQGLNTELDSQNALIDRVQTKADKVDWKVNRQNKDMQRLLKK